MYLYTIFSLISIFTKLKQYYKIKKLPNDLFGLSIVNCKFLLVLPMLRWTCRGFHKSQYENSKVIKKKI